MKSMKDLILVRFKHYLKDLEQDPSFDHDAVKLRPVLFSLAEIQMAIKELEKDTANEQT